MASYFEKLKLLQHKAYAPYSNFQVASILVMKNGVEYPGVNVENASYGGTICAERASFVSAVSNLGHGDDSTGDSGYHELYLLAGMSEKFAMPCGICRQVINEFVGADFKIVVYNRNGDSKACTISELLPDSFSRDDLLKL